MLPALGVGAQQHQILDRRHLRYGREQVYCALDTSGKTRFWKVWLVQSVCGLSFNNSEDTYYLCLEGTTSKSAVSQTLRGWCCFYFLQNVSMSSESSATGTCFVLRCALHLFLFVNLVRISCFSCNRPRIHMLISNACQIGYRSSS